MTRDVAEGAGGNGIPPREFREDDLEMAIGLIEGKMSRNGYIDEWIGKQTGRSAKGSSGRS